MKIDLKLMLCPFCGGSARIAITDEEGNQKPPEYADNPWSGLAYKIVHHSDDAFGHCPIAQDGNGLVDGGMGRYLYDTKEEATEAWNDRTY